jgi:hypothetical protein
VNEEESYQIKKGYDTPVNKCSCERREKYIRKIEAQAKKVQATVW